MKQGFSNGCSKNYVTFLPIAIFILGLLGCDIGPKPEDYDPEGSTITTSKEINFQVRRTWRFQGINFTNDYKGARLNRVEQENESLFHLYIDPENAPINNSAWYGFGVWSGSPREIQAVLHYPEDYSHRYYPKWSTDLTSWEIIDSTFVENDTIQGTAAITLQTTPDTLYIGAQPRYTSRHTYHWIDSVGMTTQSPIETIGYSVLGQPMQRVLIGNPSAAKTIVILGRQHPPEVTGYMAMRAFVNRLILDDPLAQRFREKYSILLYPMVNPDGVDHGHWRHNAAGIDLNRDWDEFNQPEPEVTLNLIAGLKRLDG
jgi:hypothetical protein